MATQVGNHHIQAVHRVPPLSSPTERCRTAPAHYQHRVQGRFRCVAEQPIAGEEQGFQELCLVYS